MLASIAPAATGVPVEMTGNLPNNILRLLGHDSFCPMWVGPMIE